LRPDDFQLAERADVDQADALADEVTRQLAGGGIARRRRAVHGRHKAFAASSLALRSVDAGGTLVDATDGFLESPPASDGQVAPLDDVLFLRFFNCEMYYTDSEIAGLERALARCPLTDRERFFGNSLRVRRRERHLFEKHHKVRRQGLLGDSVHWKYHNALRGCER